MNNNHWGTTLLGAILLLLLAGGLYTWHSLQESRRQADADAAEAAAIQRQKEAERDLRTFAETHLSDLQKLIDEIQDEIQIRKAKLEKLAEEMRRVKAVPETDPDYVKWSRAIVELEKKLNTLKEERRNTYVELKKFELNPEGKPEVDKQREARLKQARGLAETTREQFNALRTSNRPPEGTSPTELKEPEKDKGKAPSKKRWWPFG